jgi:hypothetical protein
VDGWTVDALVTGQVDGAYALRGGGDGGVPTINGRITGWLIRNWGDNSASLAGDLSNATLGRLDITESDLRAAGAIFYGTDARKYAVQYTNVRRTQAPVIVHPSIGASPWIFRNNLNYTVALIINYGTVADIELTHDGVTFENIGIKSGVVVLKAGMGVRVTYSALPLVQAWEMV